MVTRQIKVFIGKYFQFGCGGGRHELLWHRGGGLQVQGKHHQYIYIYMIYRRIMDGRTNGSGVGKVFQNERSWRVFHNPYLKFYIGKKITGRPVLYRFIISPEQIHMTIYTKQKEGTCWFLERSLSLIYGNVLKIRMYHLLKSSLWSSGSGRT